MPQTIQVPAHQAHSLIANLNAIRGETAALKAAGLLAVSVDDLLDGGGTVHAWLADLEHCVATSTANVTHLPERDPGLLQHIVYGLSSILVWADGLRDDGRMGVALCGEGLAVWAQVEVLAGLPGRTSGAIGVDWSQTILPSIEIIAVQTQAPAEIALDRAHDLMVSAAAA